MALVLFGLASVKGGTGSCHRPPSGTSQVAVGAMFPLRSSRTEFSFGAFCLSAFVMALEDINNKSDGIFDHLLPNTTLVYSFRDSESSVAATTSGVLSLLDSAFGGTGVSFIVGPETSDTSAQAALIAHSYEVPVISYSATSPRLSDCADFPFFSRTAPSDSLQVEAMVQLLSRGFLVQRVAFIGSSDDYGREGMKSFSAAAARQGMTIIASISVVADPTEEGLADVTAQLLRADARIIVLFCDAQLGGQIMLSSYKASERVGGPGFMWLRSDGVAGHGIWLLQPELVADIQLRQHIFKGSFALVPSPARSSEWDAFRSRLHGRRFSANGVCIAEQDDDGNDLWAAGLGDACSRAVADDSITQYASYTYDAVFAMAHALHDLIEFQHSRAVNGSEIYDALLKTRFEGVTGMVSFQGGAENWTNLGPGDRLTYEGYTLLNYQNGSMEDVVVGRWRTCWNVSDCNTLWKWEISAPLVFSTVDNAVPIDASFAKTDIVIVVGTLGVDIEIGFDALRFVSATTRFAAELARKHVNNNPEILPNHNISFLWVDTRCSGRLAFQAIKSAHERLQRGQGSGTRLVAFAGAQCSSACQSTATYGALERIPQVSHGCSSATLSDTIRYPYFNRVVGIDTEQADAVIVFCKRYKWTRVTLITDISEYGLAMRELMSSPKYSSTLVLVLSVQPSENDEMSPTLTDDLKAVTTADAPVVLLGTGSGGEYLFAALDIIGANGDNGYQWIGFDGLQTAFLAYASGRIVGMVQACPMFLTLPAEGNQTGLLRELTASFSQFYHETYPDRVKSKPNPGPYTGPVSTYAPLMYDAITLIAHALHNLLETGGSVLDPDAVNQQLRATTIDGLSGVFEIDQNGERKGKWTIWNLIPDGNNDVAKRAVAHFWDGALEDISAPLFSTRRMEAPPGFFPPDTPSSPQLDRATSVSVTVSWQPLMPLLHHAQLEGFIIELRHLDSDWVEVFRTTSSNTSMVLTGDFSGDYLYEVRSRLETSGGMSNYSEVSTFTSRPLLCPAGSGISLVGGVPSCEECEPGYFSALADSAPCEPCKLGSFQLLQGRTSCDSCPQGSHQPEWGSPCVPCEAPTSSWEGASSCNVCSRQHYLHPSNGVASSTTCKQCPMGSTCDWNSTVATLNLSAGHWRHSVTTTEVWPCILNGEQTPCRGGTNAGDDGDGYCKPDFFGPRCELCRQPNHYFNPDKADCQPCGEIGVASAIFFSVNIVVLVSIVIVVISRRQLERIDLVYRIKHGTQRLWAWSTSAGLQSKVKMIIGFMQCVSAVPVVFLVPLPAGLEGFETVYHILKLPSMVSKYVALTFLYDVDCLGTYREQLLISSLAPMSLIFVVVCWHAFFRLRNDLSLLEHASPIMRMFRLICASAQDSLPFVLVLTFMLMPSISTSIFQSFPCKRISYDDEFDIWRHYLQVDVSLSCDSKEYDWTFVTGISMCFVWPIGVPLLYSYLLWRNRTAIKRGLHTPQSRLTMFLHRDYEPYAYFWEPLDMVRKVVLSCGVLLISENIALARVLVCLLTSFSFFALELVVQPYHRLEDQVMGRIINVMLVLLYLALLLLKTCGFSEDACKSLGFSNDGKDLFLFFLFFALASFIVLVVASIIFVRSAYDRAHQRPAAQALAREKDVLALFSNPRFSLMQAEAIGLRPLSFGQDIKHLLREMDLRYVAIEPAATLADAQEALFKYQPRVLIFSGHTVMGSLAFEDSSGRVAVRASAELITKMLFGGDECKLQACKQALGREESTELVGEERVGSSASVEASRSDNSRADHSKSAGEDSTSLRKLVSYMQGALNRGSLNRERSHGAANSAAEIRRAEMRLSIKIRSLKRPGPLKIRSNASPFRKFSGERRIQLDEMLRGTALFRLECIVLNGCKTESIGSHLLKAAPHLKIVCWSTLSEDNAARAFSVGFYAAMNRMILKEKNATTCQLPLSHSWWATPSKLVIEAAFRAGCASFIKDGFVFGDPEEYLHPSGHSHIHRPDYINCKHCTPPVHGECLLLQSIDGRQHVTRASAVMPRADFADEQLDSHLAAQCVSQQEIRACASASKSDHEESSVFSA